MDVSLFNRYPSKGFSTLLALILLTPQQQLNRLSNLTRRPQGYFLDRCASDRAYGVAGQIVKGQPKLDTGSAAPEFQHDEMSRGLLGVKLLALNTAVMSNPA
ncbi:hypothetical protein C3Y94_027620 [Rhizobium ruizarguesonis]|nr:hypothetical protein [Rhizobium ruizarguesonis]